MGEALAKDSRVDQKSVSDVDMKAVVMNDLAYHHLVMSCTKKVFYLCQGGARC